MIDDTTVKLLSLKRQKIGMIHINCFQPKHMATYVVGARKPSQETFLLSTQNIRDLWPVGQHFFFQNSAFRAGKFYFICLLVRALRDKK